MTHDEVVEELEFRTCISEEASERALDALSFVQSLHELFKENQMTSSEEPNVDELENLIDALHGELGAAVLFLSESSFSRVPDMLRVISQKLADNKDEVPLVVVKGFERLAKRIENARVTMQQLAKNTI